MILDRKLMFLNAAAYNATPEVVDMGTTFHPEDGTVLKGRISCGGGDAADVTALVVKTGASSTTATTTIATYPMTAAQLNAGYNFAVPRDNLLQFVTISLTAISAGTAIDAGLVLDTQTA